MGGMTVDLTIRLGDILTMVGLFGGGIAVVVMMRADMKILAQRVGSIEGSFSSFAESVNHKLNGITEILVEQAKHDQRIRHVEDQIRNIQYRRDASG